MPISETGEQHVCKPGEKEQSLTEGMRKVAGRMSLNRQEDKGSGEQQRKSTTVTGRKGGS